MPRPWGYPRPRRAISGGKARNRAKATAKLRHSLRPGEHVLALWCSDCTPCGCETGDFLGIPCTSIATTATPRQREYGRGGARSLPELRLHVDVDRVSRRPVHGDRRGRRHAAANAGGA